MRILSALLALCLVLTSAPARAWNDRGHMAVAGVAWHYMTPRARARAIALVGLNPDYERWMARDHPGVAPDMAAFMLAATWPDALRGRVCDSNNRPGCVRDEGYTPADAHADMNIGYRDSRLRRYWHFMDLPYSSDGTPGHEPFRINAETQIAFFSRSLSEADLPDEARSFNLIWLLHIVGDVHQPLHATARFNADFRDGDAGGNGVTVCPPSALPCERSRARSLHSTWDGAFGEQNDPGAVFAAVRDMARLIDRPGDFRRAVRALNRDAPPRTWFEESRALAIRYAYAAPVEGGRGPYALTEKYMEDRDREAGLRIAIAGMRLARILNRVLG